MSEIVYLNGRFVPYEEALIPVEDRGFVFADGVYEVVKFYGGHPFRLDAHLERLEQSAAAIRLGLPLTRDELGRAALELAGKNGLAGRDAVLYVQVTRGPARRAHPFPADPHPTVFMYARPESGPNPALRESGVRAITVEDRRWSLCHVKSIGLLLNVLAKQQAVEAGCYEGIFVRDGIVTEGTASNLFAVFGGAIHTHPQGPHILSGVTRQAVLEAAANHGIPVVEEPFTAARLFEADEAFVTGTLTEVMPIVEIDGRRVGEGRPGPVTRRIQQGFAEITRGAAQAAGR